MKSKYPSYTEQAHLILNRTYNCSNYQQDARPCIGCLLNDLYFDVLPGVKCFNYDNASVCAKDYMIKLSKQKLKRIING